MTKKSPELESLMVKTAKPVAPKKTVVKKKEEKIVEQGPSEKKKVPRTSVFYGTGRRKCSIAKVWVFPGTGVIEINGVSAAAYLKCASLEDKVLKPLKILNQTEKYDARISVLGGGLSGQADAASLGVARALLEAEPTSRSPLKAEGLLTRDARIKERKKYGRKRARKGFQYRKR